LPGKSGKDQTQGVVVRTGALDASVPPYQAKIPSVVYGFSHFLKEKVTTVLSNIP
jgi:hypothetical protein